MSCKQKKGAAWQLHCVDGLDNQFREDELVVKMKSEILDDLRKPIADIKKHEVVSKRADGRRFAGRSKGVAGPTNVWRHFLRRRCS